MVESVFNKVALFSCEYFEIFKSTVFTEYLRTTAFVTIFEVSSILEV